MWFNGRVSSLVLHHPHITFGHRKKHPEVSSSNPKPEETLTPTQSTNLPPIKRQQVSPQYLKKIATICRERLGRGAFVKRNASLLLLLLPLLLGV
jgi:hypothetical protein